MPGPAAKHPSTRVRRNGNVTNGMTTLPSAGRKGKTPPWPLGPNVDLQAEKSVAEMMALDAEEALAAEEDGRRRRTLTRALEKARLTVARLEIVLASSEKRELAVWKEVWTYPQAVQWERDRAHRSVAMYVRWEVLAEGGDMEAAKEARAWTDRLGLHTMSLQRLKQEVERAGEAEERGETRRTRKAPAAPAGGAKGSEDPRSGLYAVS